MTIEEQKKAAYNAGRLAAWTGTAHKDPGYDSGLLAEWGRGVDYQCQRMRDEAAEIPLTWDDQMESGARAD